MSDQLRHRPGDQPLPVPGFGPSAHDLVMKDLADFPVSPERRMVASFLIAERKALGLSRYGQPLRLGNGRDSLRDLREELADAAAYARLRVEEATDDALAAAEAIRVYKLVLDALFATFPAGSLP